MSAELRPRYRAWCLSWEEDEGDGADVVSYDILHHDHTQELRGAIYVPAILFGGASDAAEAYANYVHNNRDGYESEWPLVFRVRCPDGSTADFEVDRECVPEFTATPVKQPTNAHEGATK